MCPAILLRAFDATSRIGQLALLVGEILAYGDRVYDDVVADLVGRQYDLRHNDEDNSSELEPRRRITLQT